MDDEPKQPSGYQKRKARAEREVQARKDDALRIEGITDAPPGVAELEALGMPDLEDPHSALVYARQVALVCMHQIATDKVLSSRERWRMLKDFIATLGMTHSRSAVEQKLKDVLKQKEKRRDPSGGMEPINGISRPPTARSARRTRERDEISGPVSGAPEGEDEGDPSSSGG